MKTITTRRISQVFFLLLFLWFCVASTYGAKFWQLRAWPVNWFLQLDPLVGISTILSTHTLYWPLLWGLAVIILTVLLGRFFCGWICPFGTIQHFISCLGLKTRTTGQMLKANKYNNAQKIKYFILIIFLLAAAQAYPRQSLLTGLLDPIPLITRSINTAILPIIDNFSNVISVTDRSYTGGAVVLVIFSSVLLLCLIVPRFYCRFLCPLGALFGLIDRFSIWRIGRTASLCTDCKLCQRHCQGGCEPAKKIYNPECILCFNCTDVCPHQAIKYQIQIPDAGEHLSPNLGRRGFLLSLLGGGLTVPAISLGQAKGCDDDIVRPPGSLPEEEFLKRCIKCSQCMRICPSNVISPCGIEKGIEKLWTPVMNNRIGSSGCQLNCTACSQVCPTAAIRPISLAEKQGTGQFADAGPVKIGTAVFDRNRCLPWAMDKPCIVCQENCPVSPKAIYTSEYFANVRDARFRVKKWAPHSVKIDQPALKADEFAGGDYYCLAEDDNEPRRILSNTADNIVVDSEKTWKAIGANVKILIRLQRPYVDADKCIGCGICQHECPVSGKGAIEVFADGQSRSSQKTILRRS